MVGGRNRKERNRQDLEEEEHWGIARGGAGPDQEDQDQHLKKIWRPTSKDYQNVKYTEVFREERRFEYDHGDRISIRLCSGAVDLRDGFLMYCLVCVFKVVQMFLFYILIEFNCSIFI